MITVALVGPDGAGKTTISKLLTNDLGLPVKQIYMGMNVESSTLMLPTTRLLVWLRDARRGQHPAAERAEGPPRADRDGPARRVLGSLRAGARLGVWLSEEWFRQLTAWYYAKLRGHVVVFDRHFYADYLEQTVEGADGREPLSSRIHFFLLEHAYPKPDLVIYLDAPAEVLFERKPETALEWLRRRRADYLALEDRVPRFATVDANRPATEVARDVADLILSIEGDRGPAVADKGSRTT